MNKNIFLYANIYNLYKYLNYSIEYYSLLVAALNASIITLEK